MATPSSAERRGQSCAGPKIMSQPLEKKYVEHCLGPAQDRLTKVLCISTQYALI